jgi:C1A family cysteine protease
VRVVDNSGSSKETTANFSVVRFETSFIADPAKVSISNAKIKSEYSKIISIENLIADDKNYQARLEWVTVAQRFQITQIDLIGTANSTVALPSRKSLSHIIVDKPEELNIPIKPNANGDVIFALEEPTTGSVYSGISNIRGWAVAPTGINRVELLIDGVAYSNIPIGGRRKDVGGNYPDYLNADQSGFSMAFNYSGLTAGSHTLTVRVVDNSGSTKETTANFSVARFENSFITNPDSINLNNAQITHDSNLITIKNMMADGKSYDVTLQWYSAMQGFAITQISSAGAAPANRPPVASPLSIQSNPAIPLVQLQLIGTDPDGDTLIFMLDSPSVGSGYNEAYVTPQSGKLYVTLDGSGTSLDLAYRVSDGLMYSEPAKVLIEVDSSTKKKGTGLYEIAHEIYSRLRVFNPYGDVYGAPGDDASLPKAIDLSANFPIPGNQGDQGSCVGWATAYALKSYQEKIEIGWSLDRQDQLFSPAFVFNQITADSVSCSGSQIYKALDLLENTGAATLGKMGYTDLNCTTQPTNDALQEAANFKIRTYGTLRTVEEIKAQLANYKPVVMGIIAYDSLFQLRGSDSVYNAASGRNQGGHAVTVVGYDDDRYGGAFKVINSWGAQWGDKGYFWLTYDFVRQGIMVEAYGVEDSENVTNPQPVDPSPPPSSLPNLQVTSWEANYDPKPGGSGKLQWRVKNVGTASASSGAYVVFVLSDNSAITSADVVVVYDEIPFEILPGEGAYRDSDNTISFRFPDTLTSGTYYMAVWVDPLDTIRESNENDNISLGRNQVAIENTLPDLLIESWYAEWNTVSGDGLLNYKIVNQGKTDANAGWDINLIISPDQILDKNNPNDYYLFYEDIPFPVVAGNYVYRDQSNPAPFNLYISQEGNSIAPGIYYMAVWADDLNEVTETNERNNISWGQNRVTIDSDTQSQTMDETTISFRQFNGKVAPPANIVMRKVEISSTVDGGFQLKMLDEDQKPRSDQYGQYAEEPRMGTQEEPLMLKTVKSRDIGVFPTSKEWPMPR